MATSAQGHSEFAARLNRIEARGAGVAEMFSGDESQIIGGRKAYQKVKRVGLAWMMKLPLSLVIGAAAVIAAKYISFRIGPLPEEYSDPIYQLGGEITLALALVLMAQLIFDMTRKWHMLFSFLGLLAASALLHNLVHLAPEVWATAFSSEWVSGIRANTEPNTAQFHTLVLSLG